MDKKENKIEKIKTNIKEKIDVGKEKAKEQCKKIDEFVKEKPYKSLSIVAGVSAALGAAAAAFLLRKKK